MASRLLNDSQHRSFPNLAGRQTSHPLGREASLASRHVHFREREYPASRNRLMCGSRFPRNQGCIVHPGVLWPQLRHTSDIRAGSKCRTIAWPLKPQRAHTSRSTVITAAARNRDQRAIHRSRAGTPVEEMGSTSATSIRSSSSGPVRVTPLLGNAASTAKPRNPQVAAP